MRDLVVAERSVAARPDGHRIALFRTVDGMLHSADNRDPGRGATAPSRGVVGTAGDAPTVAVHEVRRSGDPVGVRVSG